MEQEQKSHVAEAKEQNLHRCHDKEGQLLKPDAGLGECQVHADGYQQKEHRLNNHVGGVPAEGDQAFYRKKAHKGQGQLTGQHTPQVSQDSVSGDGKEHKCQPDDHGAHILEKVEEVLPRPFRMLPMVVARYMKGHSQERMVI